MTFYEAALRVLESAGRPLHVLEITEQSIAQNMLSHVGKAPDKTMLSRLAAMARRTRDRRVIVTAKDTFALAEWTIPEDAEALAQTGLPESNPEESLPPLRSVERHPEARVDNVRAAGRADRRRKHEEEEDFRGRKRRPAISELVLEILSEAERPMKPEQIAQLALERELASTELSKEQILTSLLEDNQRRIDSGRRPQFVLSTETGEVALERTTGGESAPRPDVQTAFAAALGIPIEAGRPVIARSSVSATAELVDAGNAAVKAAAKESRRTLARELRRRVAELDIESLHKAFARVLQALGFRELKVAKRSREGLLLTARKREGSVDLRFAVRLLRGAVPVDRRTVQDLRRDLGHYSAQVGLVASPGDLRGDGRAEAQSHGSLTMVWSGDALGDKFIEAKAGVTSSQVEVFEVDEAFFSSARIEADEARRRRDERMRERQAREGRRPEEGERDRPPGELAAADASAGDEQSPGDSTALGAAEGEPGETGPEDLADDAANLEADEAKAVPGGEGASPAPPADRKRRRRSRRGRRKRPRPTEAGPTAAQDRTQTPAAAPEAPADEAPPPPARTVNEPQ